VSAIFWNRLPSDLPVAFVDLDQTPLSRQLARMADAHELVRISTRAASLAEAERLVLRGDAGGILAIPSGFERDVKRGAPATVGVFADATYFLVYRQALTGFAEATATLSAGIEVKRLQSQGMPEAKALTFRDPLPLVARIFGFPVRGGGLAAAALVVPFLLSTSFLGLALSVLFRRREAAMQTLLFTSLPAIFLASYAWPSEALPGWLRVASQAIPSTRAIPALLRVNQIGASLAHVRHELAILWGLSVVFFVAAALAQAARASRAG
jgi:hypothetical protein